MDIKRFTNFLGIDSGFDSHFNCVSTERHSARLHAKKRD